MSKFCVNTFWHGPKNPLIELCIKSILINSPGSRLWSLDDFHAEYDGSLGDWRNIEKQDLNVISDIFRGWVLHTNGGVWVDADCIAFRGFLPITMPLDNGFGFVAYKTLGWPRANGDVLCSALIASKPHENGIVGEFFKQTKNMLATGSKLGSLALGPIMWAKCFQKMRNEKVYYIQRDLVHPLPRWSLVASKSLSSTATYDFHQDAFCFMLTKRLVGEHVGRTKIQLMEDRTALGQALRRALCPSNEKVS